MPRFRCGLRIGCTILRGLFDFRRYVLNGCPAFNRLPGSNTTAAGIFTNIYHISGAGGETLVWCQILPRQCLQSLDLTKWDAR